MEATKTYFDQLMEDKDFRIKLAEEIFLLEATETIAKAMKKRHQHSPHNRGGK